MSKSILLYILFGTFIYIVSLVAALPANRVVNHLLPASASSYIKYQGISGSIWNGQATQFSVRQIALGKLQWDLSFIPLFWGTADVQLTSKRDGALLVSDVAIRSRSISLQDTRFEIGIADLMPLFYGFPISLDGNIKAFFKSIEIDPASRMNIEGRAVLSDINLLAPQDLSLGNLVATFENNDNGTRININDKQGPVQVDAVVTLAETGFYTVNATLTPRASSDASIKNALAMFAKADSQGRYTYNTRGRIPLKF